MYNLSEPELDAVASGANSVHLVFLGTAVGGLIAFLVALLTVPQMNTGMRATFVGLLAVSALATAYFGIRAAGDLRSKAERLKRIKQRRWSGARPS